MMNGRKTLAAVLLGATLGAGCQKDFKPDPRGEADGHYLKGTSEYLHGNFDAALSELALVRKLNPDDPRLPAAVGEVYLSQGKLPEAQQEFETAVQRDSRRATNWSRLGFIQLQRGDADAARSSLGRALELNPGDFNALEALADLHLREGSVDEAVKGYTAAGRIGPAAGKAALYLKASGLLEKKGRSPEALAVLEDAARSGVKSPELSSTLGDLKVKAGDLAGAAQAYQEAALQSPKDPGPWELVGRIQARLGRAEEAAQAFQKSLAVKDRAVVHVELARLAIERGDREAARAELDKGLAAGATEDASADETLELAELLLAFDRKKDALALYKLLAAEPDGQKDAELQLKTARLAKEVGAGDAVKEACARLAALKPGPAAKCP